MRILLACEMSGVVRDEFRARGHDAWSCDLMCCMRGPKHHILGNVLDHLDDGWDMIIAFPPCTHLASSGAGHFKKKIKSGKQQAAIDFFMRFVDSKIRLKGIENPVGIMSTQYRKPDQIIQPWWFGNSETKATCLWLFGLPKLKATNPVEPEYIHRKGKRYSPTHFMGRKNGMRGILRSKTYSGVAIAMADQWSTPQTSATCRPNL